MNDVNNRLHTLRGEHFRHTLNLARAQTSPPTQDTHTAAWRARALSLVIPAPAPRVPPLTTLCLRLLAPLPAHALTHDVVPWLAPHLRRDLVRDAAIHSPLCSAQLWAVHGSAPAAGELVVVSPQASLREDYFVRNQSPDDDWDTDTDTDELHTLALVSARLAASTVLSLPATITRLALVDLGAAVPLHRLPRTCSLLVVLDLSYNSWLCTSEDSERALERVEWSRWHDLRVLGLRGCAVSITILGRLNKGRWDDVEVVQ